MRTTQCQQRVFRANNTANSKNINNATVAVIQTYYISCGKMGGGETIAYPS